MSMIKAVRRSLAALALGVCAGTAQSEPFYTYSFQTAGLETFLVGSSTFLVDQSALGSVWGFCRLYDCSGYESPGIVPETSALGPFWMPEDEAVLSNDENINLNNKVVDLTVAVFPDFSAEDQIGKYIYSFDLNEGEFSALPDGTFYATVLTDYLGFGIRSAYGSPGSVATFSFSIAGEHDYSALPNGFFATTETEVEVSFMSYWSDEQGQGYTQSDRLYHQIYAGSFDETLDFSTNILLDPIGQGLLQGGHYVIGISNKILVGKVPEPSSLILLGLGLLALRITFRRFC